MNMIRPIKFRALGIDGDFHFGDLQQLTRTVAIREQGKGTFYVDPDTVAQFVDYDANGDEVYEGDTLVNSKGEESTAYLLPNVLTDEGFFHDIPIETLALKELKK